MGQGSCGPGLGVQDASQAPAGHRPLGCAASLSDTLPPKAGAPEMEAARLLQNSASEVRAPPHCIQGWGYPCGKKVGVVWVSPLKTGHHSQKTSGRHFPIFQCSLRSLQSAHFTVTLTRPEVPSLSDSISCLAFFFRTVRETAPELVNLSLESSWMLQLLAPSEGSVLFVGAAFLSFVK